MMIQLSTDNHIQGSADLQRQVESVVEASLERFGDRITRVEVHLSDENSAQKDHGEAIRCRIEARPAGLQPVAVTADATNVDQAVDEAAEKLKRLLDSTFGKLDNPRP
jgi:ribosome-associated translation inhibitor RaiA